MPETIEEQQELYFSIDNPDRVETDHTWYQDNLDIIFPVIIILTGLFQFVLRKWILPVSEDVISKLEDQFPSQGLIYNPAFGIVLMILGAVLLVIFNISFLFS